MEEDDFVVREEEEENSTFLEAFEEDFNFQEPEYEMVKEVEIKKRRRGGRDMYRNANLMHQFSSNERFLIDGESLIKQCFENDKVL